MPTPPTASFHESLLPMLVADDHRRYVSVNRAACLLLRAPPEDVLQLRIDDVTPPELLAHTERLWAEFLSDGVQSGNFEMLMPDGVRVAVDYSARANVAPGRHLSVLSLPWRPRHRPRKPAEDVRATRILTAREREVLALVAMGERSASIAHALAVSPATVEAHVRSCFEKLGARSRAHAVTRGLQLGELALDLGAAAGERAPCAGAAVRGDADAECGAR